MMWDYGGFGFVWMGLVWVGMILVFLGAINYMNTAGRSGQSRATQILEERFARGEVDRDEFETRRRELTN